MSSKVVYEGWMVRYGRRKIGRSFIHMRYFVLESRLLAYYKRKPQDNQVPIKTLLIDGSCRVEDRGLKTHHGHMVYVLSVYNKKEKYNRITMAAFNIQEALIWKEKIEYVIDQCMQHQGAQPSNGNKYISFEYKSGMDNGKTASSSDRESQNDIFSNTSAVLQKASPYVSSPSLLLHTPLRPVGHTHLLHKPRSHNALAISHRDLHCEDHLCCSHQNLYQTGIRDRPKFSAQEDEDEAHPNLLRRTTIGNGPPESIFDWTREIDSDLSNQNISNQAFSRKHWRLLQCENGLRIFEELLEVDYLPRSCSRAMKAVGVVEATCEEIFELVMSMDGTRFEWDCSFQHGSLVEEVDGHTAVLYHRLQLDWFPILYLLKHDLGPDEWLKMVAWPQSLCGPVIFVMYVIGAEMMMEVMLFYFALGNMRIVVHSQGVFGHILRFFQMTASSDLCGSGSFGAYFNLISLRNGSRQGGGFNISPLKPRNGRPRTQVQHLMQIDLKGWGVGYMSSFQQHCLRQMLNCVAGLREWFTQTDERNAPPRIPVMVNMSSASVSSKKTLKPNDSSVHPPSLDQLNSASRNSAYQDEYSDEDEDFQIAEPEQEAYPIDHENDARRTVLEEEPADEIDLSSFTGNLRRDDRDNARDCWKISDGNNFRVRSKHFCYDKSKVPAGKHLLDLVAVDWLKDSKRMDHVAKCHGCAAQVASEKGFFSIIINLQVPGSTHYSMVFYFVTRELVPGSLLQRFVDGDDEFRNSRLKLIPSVPKGSWIVRQSVGSTPCILGKAVDCNYIRGPKYLEIDVDIGSSTVANGVLGLVVGVITTLVVDMAFLIQANTPDELPEKLIGAVRVSHLELKSAIVPKLDPDPS
uniref:PH domain-containing protein n=1 Tax=Lupinus angustifolius TaxID=3871 RepID=L0P0X4_LUPAN|nr:hypothetical protein [Lupinus angustifolius]